MVQYGMPYKGSKSRIADAIVDILPPCDTLYDLFAGGCAITHCALLRTKFERYVSNDINGSPSLFWDCIHGKHHDDVRWVERREFFASEELFVKMCFSFGTDCKTYIYGEDIVGWKKALHMAVVFRDYEPMRKNGHDLSFLDKGRDWRERRYLATAYFRIISQLERLQNLEHLQHLENLERLERLERLEQDYKDIKIRNNSVLYCDIPYKDTNDYGIDFDHDAFYEWALNQTNPVYISSYEMPDEFEPVLEIPIQSTLAAKTSVQRIEKVFIPRGQEHIKTTLF